MKQNSATNSEAGFTVIEAIVAMVIFSLTFFTLYSGMSGTWRALQVSNSAATALEITKAKLAAAGIEVPLQDGQHFEGEEKGISWRVDVQRYESSEQGRATAGPEPFSVTAQANWRDALLKGSNALTLSTIKLKAVP